MDCKLDIGSYKVSWFDDQDKHLLRSVMFQPDARNTAMLFAKSKKSSLVMKLVDQEENSYSWKLDDAKTWQMDLGRLVFENKIVLLLMAFLLVMGMIFVVQKIFLK